MKTRAYLLMILVTAIWGSTFVVVKGALTLATPSAYNAVRMAFAFAVLAVVYRRWLKQINCFQIVAGAIAGFFLAVGYGFQTNGLALTTPSKSAFLTGLCVVLVPLLSAIPGLGRKGSRVRWNGFAGALLGFLGILLLTLPATGGEGLAGLLSGFSSINAGDLLTLGCALGFALHCIALSHLSPRIDYRPLAVLQVGFCALFMALSLPLTERPHLHWNLQLVTALSISAVLSTAVGFSVQSWVQSVLPPTHTALIMALESVFAWITSFLVLHERLGLRPSIGAVMILAGIALTELIPQPHLPSAHEA